ncbi:MAG: proline/betaine transporter [Candidatus Midichloriaceae bacterium]|jgi:MHS family proline/betaine transporter-like MFS transporter|nr:proline/betaine transporter [Candidatus Midichloriaceae bacterium]
MYIFKNNNIKIVSAAMVGHILEFFDFTIYAVFAAEIGAAFFPSDSSFAQLLSSLAVLAIGFFARPVGGLLFGHIGDKFGRRMALTISVLGMAAATFAMALLPTYADIGILAPLFLVIFRLIQGLCIGGEGAGASIFVLEHLSKLKPGLIGGIVNSALTIGILLAICTGLILNNFMPGELNLWRYAFAIGGAMGLIGLYTRLCVEETPVFLDLQAKGNILELPIKEVMSKNFKSVILTVMVGGLTGCSAYMVMTFVDIFYKSALNWSPQESLKLAVYGNILLIFFLPIMGMVSDKVGYSRTLAFGALLSIVASVPIFMMMSDPNIDLNYCAVTILSAISSIIYAPLYPFMLKLFTPEQRYSGIACSLNMGIAIFGGTSSMACLSLIEITGLLYAPAFYWSFVSALFLVTLLALKPRSLMLRGGSVSNNTQERVA